MSICTPKIIPGHRFWPTKVFATLVQLLFAVDKLDFSKSIDHVECFAGTMSVTKGEWGEASHSLVPTAFPIFNKKDILHRNQNRP